MKTSCISWPENKKMVIIREDQVEMCGGNICAAALLSFFEYWHNIKMEMIPKSAFLNVVAVEHGEEGTHDTSLYQFHNMTELSTGIMGIYKRDAIIAARKLLNELGIITEHRNPSGRYKFDNTVYYLFHPEIVQEWLSIRHNGKPSYRQSENRHIENADIPEKRYIDFTENRRPPSENRRPPSENRRTITEITSKTTSENVVVGAGAEKIPEFTISTQGVLGVDDAIETNIALKRWLEYFVKKGYSQWEYQTVDTVPMFLEWEKKGVTDDDMVFAEIAVSKSLKGKKPTTPLYYRQIVADIVEKRKSQDTAVNGPGSQSSKHTKHGEYDGTKRRNNETNFNAGRKPTAQEIQQAARRAWEAKQQRQSFDNATPIN